MKGERTDRLRRRPTKVRYFYLAVSNTALHTGMSHGGLHYVKVTHDVKSLYFADLVTKKVIEVKEPIIDFMNRWRLHYNEPTWCYEQDIEEGVSAPKYD